ncbi:MAG TPA: type II toxin-antitoxin system VapC family toxin [Firmicutes bacterium]|nr:type II toxin-antitoxin system VapC family toxin [Bacillota bacterium]
MSGEPPLIYLDTSVFLAYFKGENGRVEDCQAVLREAEAGQIRALSSVLTLAEACRGNSMIDEQLQRIDAFFEHSWLRVVVLDRRIAIKARKLAREYKLKPPDAIHLATAIVYGAQCFYTYDKDDLLRFDQIEGVRIMEPTPLNAQLVLK